MNLNAELIRERRARLAAERMLALRQRELEEANALLGRHANALTEEVVERREEAEDLREQTDQALQDLKVAQTEIHIAKRRLWDSIETIEDGFAVFDSNDELIVANTAYLSVFDELEMVAPGVGYANLVSVMLEEGIADIGELSPADWRQMVLERWATPKPDPLTIRLWNGRFIKLIDRRSADGDTVSLALDITDTIRNQRKLERAKDRAQAASRAKSSFLARMSHELRTPMNGVVGMADLLAETGLDEEQSLFVDTIRSSGKALLELINDVLDFSKLEAAKFVLVRAEFELRQLISEVLRLFEPAVQTRPVELKCEIDDGTGERFFGDPGRIRQVLTNLIGNAVKFTEEGSVHIRVSPYHMDGEVQSGICVSVRDTGVGIPKERLDYVFGEFNQVDDEKNRKFEGTGLGLSITRQLTDLMGGQISVESEEGVGSEFVVKLPLQPIENTSAQSEGIEVENEPEVQPHTEPEAAAQDSVQESASPRRMRILAAEDNATNRLVFQKLVKSLNIDLAFAENGKLALEAWEDARPDIIFMDISMPEMDGKEATREIRRREGELNMSRVPIVALTAHAVAGDEREILSAGLDHYLTKPLKKDKIFERIWAAMPADVQPVFPDGIKENVNVPAVPATEKLQEALFIRGPAALADTTGGHEKAGARIGETIDLAGTKKLWAQMAGAHDA